MSVVLESCDEDGNPLSQDLAKFTHQFCLSSYPIPSRDIQPNQLTCLLTLYNWPLSNTKLSSAFFTGWKSKDFAMEETVVDFLRVMIYLGIHAEGHTKF